MTALSSTLRRSARTVGMGALTAAMLTVYKTHGAIAPSRRPALLAHYRAFYLDQLLAMFDVRAVLEPPVAPPARGARLVVANHRSAIDILLLLRYFGGTMLSRADVAKWPVIGAAAREAGTIFVERAEGMKRVSAARVVRRRLAAGETVTVFGEGTTYGGDDVRPFHAGLFAALRDLDAEVLPVGIAYEEGAEYREPNFMAHLANTAARPSTRVSLVVGDPIASAPDPRALSDASRAAVQALVHRARARLTNAAGTP